jgi:glycine reductase
VKEVEQGMALTLERCVVRGLAAGPTDRLEQGQLQVDAQGLAREILTRDPRLVEVAVHFACPGEATRVLCCKDVIQPRLKVEGDQAGEGVVRLLDNLAVVTCGPIVGFQEGIIDMSGPGATYTPFSALYLVVLKIEVTKGLPAHQHEMALREAGIHAARRIAALSEGCRVDSEEVLRWDEQPVGPTLPRIAYVDLMLSQGLLHDTWVLGENAASGLPQIFDPRVLLDDAVISGNCVSACDKNTTYHHQNNPVIRELLHGHGRRWNFVGVIATNCPTRLAEKERSAEVAVALTRGLEADGAIISKEGFGNPDADLMMLIRGLTRAGIQSVAITDEFAGRDGGSQSLADATPEAEALISTGNANQLVRLPPMATTIGPLPDVERLAGGYAGCLDDDGSLEVELQAIMGATNELGFSRLSCRGV